MFRICIFVRRFCQQPVPVVEPMKFLNVAEKNDAAKTIAGLLSRGAAQRKEGLSKFNKIYEFEHDVLNHKNAKMIMTSVSGHLLNQEFDSQYRSWERVDPIKLFDAPISKTCLDNFLGIKKTLEREVRGCQGLVIWTDCDREGENIGFEIIEVCRAIKPGIPVYRAKFSEITAVAVKRALANLVPPDELQSAAVDVRSELDLRIGAAFTRFQTMRYQRIFPDIIERHLVSYGSCQIPTLGFVAKRFREVEAFQPQPFWKLRLTHVIDQLAVDYTWARNRLFDQQCCAAIFQLCRLQQPLEATVVNVTNKPKSKWRPTPMDTIELEKLGSRKLKMSAKQTMTVAEKLYTKGFISYPRTETNMFSKEIDLRPLVEMQVPHPTWGSFASKVLLWGINPRNGSKSDQAHPPIHPTKLAANLDGDESKVYELITRHFLACVSRDATGDETVVSAVLSDEEFTATGLYIHQRNYLEVYIYDRWNAKEIHPYETGQTFEPTSFAMVDGKTTAPNLLTEAELIALMDKHGIGTDATHAEHINTVMEREYVGKIENNYLVPGKLGMGLVEGYESIDLPLAEPLLRAGLEKDLKLICEGKKQAKHVLEEQINIYRDVFRAITQKATRMDEQMGRRLESQPTNNTEPVVFEEIVEVCKCPKCGRMMALKFVNNSYCFTCLNYPTCRNTIWLPGSVVKKATASNKSCVKCGPDFKCVQYTLRSFRHSIVLDQRLMGDDGLTYETCLMCDASFQDLCNVSRALLSPQAVPEPPTTRRVAPPVQRNNNPTPQQPPPPYRATAQPQRNPPAAPSSNRSYAPPHPPSSRPTAPPPPPSNGNDTIQVKCNKCNKVARKLTVRKDGPNQGREFYSCGTECNFFQWADAPASTRPSFAPNDAAGSWGGASDVANTTTRAKRKCSQCRQEGHSRNKCPRLQS